MADLSVINWAQNLSNPALTTFFKAITFTGSLEFYMLAIPIFYWLVDKHFGFRFSIFFIFSAYLNSGAKYLAKTERPPRELRLVIQEGFSFPSGHAQGSTAFWGFLALRLKTRWGYALAALMVALVSLSRIYLGVHWPIDLLGGITIGLLLLYLYQRFGSFELEKASLISWIVGSVLIALALFWLQPVGDGPMTVGFMFGALIGYRLELLYVKFEEKGNLAQLTSRLALGLIVLFLLRIVLKPVVSWIPGELSTVVRYGFLGLWASLGAPFVFVKLRLAKQIA